MREFPLTVSDQSEIDALKAKGLDAAQIAGELRRSKRAIAYYLSHRQPPLTPRSHEVRLYRPRR